MAGEVHKFLSGCDRYIGGGRNVPFDPRSEDTEKVCKSLKHEVHAPEALAMPAWGGAGNLDPKDLVALQNGILNIRTKDRLQHTPLFWSPNVLEFDNDPQADCPRFMKFLSKELFPNDLQAQWAVMEWIGYCLTDDTKYQKILLLIGPPRSGKGTLIRLIKGITGPANFHATSIHDFAGRFGLASAIGKKVVAIPEFVTDGVPPSVLSAMATRLKSISGEDDVTVQRKNIDDWTGRLYAKVVLAANQTPRLKDFSGAIATRFIVVRFSNSFLGNEDYDLDEVLKAERPGIFNLALRALDQMRGRDGTKLRGPIQPDSGRDAKNELEHLTSDILAFVEECCELGPTFEVPLDRIFLEYRQWGQMQNKRYSGEKNHFTAALRGKFPQITVSRVRESILTTDTPTGNGTRPRVLKGIKLG
jgi:putative DNA primase/helicase